MRGQVIGNLMTSDQFRCVNRRLAILIECIHVRPQLHQCRYAFEATAFGRQVQGRICLQGSVGIRAAGEKQFDQNGVLALDGTEKWRARRFCCQIDVCTPRNQQFGGILMAMAGGIPEWCRPPAVTLVMIGLRGCCVLLQIVADMKGKN